MIDDVEFVMIHALRCPSVAHLLMKAGLTGDHFNPVLRYQPIGVAWKTLVQHIVQYGQMMNRVQLEAGCSGNMDLIQGVADVVRNDIVKFLDVAFSISEEDLSPDNVIDQGLVQKVIDQFVLSPAVQQLASITDPAALTEHMATVNTVYDTSRVVVSREANIFSDELGEYLFQGPPDKTHIDWIDKPTGGLHRGSMCGLLAESAGGKTMGGVQLVCEQAIWDNHVAAFYYEQSIQGDIATRILTYSAGLTREVADKYYPDEYTPEQLNKIEAVKPQMAKYFHAFDMSGKVKGQGQGCVQEIDSMLGEMENACKAPSLVLIDWLGPMVIAAHSLPEHADAKDLRQKIDLTLNGLKRVSEKHNTTVFVLHQIAPNQIANKSPAFKPDWTVAQECKSFGQLMDYVFVFGRKDSNQRMWCCTPKARGQPISHRIVQMDAMTNQIRDVHDKFFFNEGAGGEVFLPKGKNHAGTMGNFDDEVKEGLQ